MDKDWRLITGFAILGFVLAALIFLYVNFVGEFDGDLYTVFAVLCPPALLCIPFSEVMKGKSGLYAIWSLIGFLNSGLYAVLAAAVVGLLKGSPSNHIDLIEINASQISELRLSPGKSDNRTSGFGRIPLLR